MNGNSFKPDPKLMNLWLTITIIASVAIWLVSILPIYIPSLFDDDIPFAMIAWIITLCYALVAVPLLIWIPAFVHRLEYTMDNRSVRATSGVFWKKHVTVPFAKITNIDVTQGPLQRAFGLSTLHLQTAGAAGSQGGAAELRIYGVRDAEALKELIAQHVFGGGADDGTSGVSLMERAAASSSPASGGATLDDVLAELRSIREALERR